MEPSIQQYLGTVAAAIAEVNTAALEEAVEVLYRAWLEGRQVFVFGNGASAALANHMAADLGKLTALDLGRGPAEPGQRRLRITSLSANMAWVTALGNDLDYGDVFLEQLKNYLDRGDLVIGISGSGGSPNVLRALEYSRCLGATTLGLTGQQMKAEDMRRFCDVLVQAPLQMMEQIEDLHVMFHHIMARRLFARISEAG